MIHLASRGQEEIPIDDISSEDCMLVISFRRYFNGPTINSFPKSIEMMIFRRIISISSVIDTQIISYSSNGEGVALLTMSKKEDLDDLVALVFTVPRKESDDIEILSCMTLNSIPTND